MADIHAFQERLGDVLTLARTNGGRLTREGVDYFFSQEELTPEQMESVYEYLKLQGIALDGETLPQKSGEAAEEEPVPLSAQEEEYLRIYEESLRGIAPAAEEEKKELFERLAANDENARARLTELYLPEVVRAVRELHTRPELLAEDMIQEGNMHLFLTLGSWEARGDGSHDYLCAEIRRGIRTMLQEQAQQKSEDESLVERVRRLEAAVRELSGDDGDVKFSVEELSAYLDMDAEEIQDILRLAGEEQ